MTVNIGDQYITQIPGYDENADIQTALRVYHYGEDTQSPDPIEPNSIAGHLKSLDDTKLDVVPDIIPDSANLNNYNTTGYYVQTTAASAETGANYPTYPNAEGDPSFFAGLLKVVNSGSIVFQEYHTLGESGYIVNRPFRRVFFGSWSSWESSATVDDVTAVTDIKYYQKSQVFTKTEAGNAFAPKYFLETEKTADHTLVLEDINRVISMNVPTGGVLTVPTNATAAFPVGSVINVYNASPTAFLEIRGADGVTVRNPGTIEPYQEASLRKRAANEWVAAGPVY